MTRIKLSYVRPTALILLASLATLSASSAIVQSTGIIRPTLFLYTIQPAMALVIFGMAVYLSNGLQDRVRQQSDRAFLVGSVVAIWFVLYFMSGLITTYTNNSLVVGPKSILLNIWSFGVVAFAIEYARHRAMLLAGRRHIIWFGTTVSLVLAIQQMSFGQMAITEGIGGFVKLGVSDFIPAIVSSFLLTYLAISGGLPSMLAYRLGLVATVIFPPIIPKYDWYLQGVSLVLLAITVYIVMDRKQQEREAPANRRHKGQTRLAYNIMFLLVMAFLAMFMKGFFSYTPLTIVSNSMKPVYSRGSMVVVQKVDDPMDIKEGDIVQYKRTSIMITHRVIDIKEGSGEDGKRVFITQGDNSPSKDVPVKESQIVGVVKAQIPLVGYPTVWLREVSGLQRIQS